MAKAAAPSGGPRLTCETSERNAEALKTNKDLEKKNVAIVNETLLTLNAPIIEDGLEQKNVAIVNETLNSVQRFFLKFKESPPNQPPAAGALV